MQRYALIFLATIRNCGDAYKQASACRFRRRNSLRSSGLHHSKEKLKNMRYHSLSFWYSLHCFVLLPRRLGYKEYLRISSDILLSRKLGYKKYFKIFSDILYTRACEVGGKKTPFLRQPVLSVFVTHSTVEIIGKWAWTGFRSLGSSGVEVPKQSLRASSQPAPALHHHPLRGSKPVHAENRFA